MKAIVVKMVVPLDNLESALVSLVETTAMTYWGRITEAKNKPGRRFRHPADKLLNGGTWTIEDNEDSDNDGKPTIYTLTRSQLLEGIQTLATLEPTHFSDLVGGSGDQNTADALLQCALFGQTQYA